MLHVQEKFLARSFQITSSLYIARDHPLVDSLWIGNFKVSCYFSFLRFLCREVIQPCIQWVRAAQGVWSGRKDILPNAFQNEKKHLSCINNLKIGQIHSFPRCFVLAGKRFQQAAIRDGVFWDKLLTVMVPGLSGERGRVTVPSACRICKNCLWLQL